MALTNFTEDEKYQKTTVEVFCSPESISGVDGELIFCFPLALANIRQWPLVPFFQISLKVGDLDEHFSVMSIMGGAFIQHSWQ